MNDLLPRRLVVFLLVAVALCGVPVCFGEPGEAVEAGQTTIPGSVSSSGPKYYKHLIGLCVGVNKYQSEGIPALEYAESDARDVAAVLRERFGFDVTLVLGGEATRTRLETEIAALMDTSRVGPEDGVVFYFSGHGQTVPTPEGEQGYLVPYDAQLSLDDLKNPAPFRRYAIRMDDLRADADAIPARHVLFLVDACYSGYAASTKGFEAAPEIRAALSYRARQVITAGTRGEQAVEDAAWGHGAFTYKLLEFLRGENRVIAATELGSEMKKRVPRTVAERIPGKILSPQVRYLSGEGDFILVPKGVELPPLDAVAKPNVLPDVSGFESIANKAELRQKAAEAAFAAAAELNSKAGVASADKIQAWELAMKACGPVSFHIGAIQSRLSALKAELSQASYTENADCELGLEMVRLPSGSVQPGEIGLSDSAPRVVEINGSWMGKCEVTVGQFRKFTTSTGYKTDAEKAAGGFLFDEGGGKHKVEHSWQSPGFMQADQHPVIWMTWNDAKAFCDWLATSTGCAYQLPQESLWIYACRAGSSSAYGWGDDPQKGKGWLNCADRSYVRAKADLRPGLTAFDDGFVYTSPVASFRPNQFGLFDMYGNAWEWCAGRSDGKRARPMRGGGWGDEPFSWTVPGGDAAASASNSYGFRVARVTQER